MSGFFEDMEPERKIVWLRDCLAVNEAALRQTKAILEETTRRLDRANAEIAALLAERGREANQDWVGVV